MEITTVSEYSGDSLKRPSSELERPSLGDVALTNPSASSSQKKDANTGRIINERWQLLSRLAEGGMGIVYEALHLEKNEKVALKILQKPLRLDEMHIDRFYHEARILRRLRHPNITTVYEFGFEEDLGFYLVMELLHGCGLDVYQHLYKGRIPIELIATLFPQICDGMAYAHEQQVLHRDLKPENIFILQQPSGPDRIKILDFGVGKIIEDKLESITIAGKTVGTPRYISPEQAVGLPLDVYTDIYSISVILFEILAGRPLFEAENPTQYMSHHVFTDPPLLSDVTGDLYPKSLERLLRLGLSKHAPSRPASMREIKRLFLESMAEMGTFIPEEILRDQGEMDEAGSYHVKRPIQDQAKAKGERSFNPHSGEYADAEMLFKQQAASARPELRSILKDSLPHKEALHSKVPSLLIAKGDPPEASSSALPALSKKTKGSAFLVFLASILLSVLAYLVMTSGSPSPIERRQAAEIWAEIGRISFVSPSPPRPLAPTPTLVPAPPLAPTPPLVPTPTLVPAPTPVPAPNPLNRSHPN